MEDIEAQVAEIAALVAHIEAMNAEMASKGFTMASDTKLRLSEAAKLVDQAEELKPETTKHIKWAAKADVLTENLRAEAGNSFVKA